MSRTLQVFHPIAAPLGAAETILTGAPESWLPGGTRPAGPRIFRVTLSGLGVERPVVATVGSSWLSDEGTWRRFSWYPAADANDVLPVEWVLPSFDGELGVHRGPDGGISLVLSGTYDVPGAKLGELVDQVALSGVARRTAERLLADIGQRLTNAASALTA